MRSIVIFCMAAVSVFGGIVAKTEADTKAEIISTVLVWDRANHLINPDLIRFGDRWLLACQESAAAGWPGGAIRILTSADGNMWGSIALIESPTPKRGLYSPAFTLGPDGQLMVSALGFLPYPNSPDPLPRYGGLRKTLVWSSRDGRDWSRHRPVGQDNFPLERVVWHDGIAFSCAKGTICGSAQTIHIMASKDGRTFESRYKETLRGIMPYEGEVLFEGDTAYCLVTGYSKAGPTGVLGTAKAPYTAWEWKELDQQIRQAKFIRLPDKRVIATAGLYDGKARTSLCQFDPATGKFTELLGLPTGKAVSTGLAWHDGHLWVTYPVADRDKHSLHLAKVKLR